MLNIMVKDAPTELQELWLNVSQVKVHRESGVDENWNDVRVVTKYFDLLKLQNISEVLATSELTVGNYTEIRFRIIEA